MMIDKQKLLDILTSEIESSTGCTDPGSVCLAVAVAAHTLGRRPEKIDVLVSPNIYKNGVSVGIPGTNRIGRSRCMCGPSSPAAARRRRR